MSSYNEFEIEPEDVEHDPLEVVLNELEAQGYDRRKVPTDEESNTLWRRFNEKGDLDARDQLITRHAPLLVALSRRNKRIKENDPEDLFQNACIKIQLALPDFDPTVAPFAGFVTSLGNMEMKQSNKSGGLISVHRYILDQRKDVGRAHHELFDELSAEPSYEQVMIRAREIRLARLQANADHTFDDDEKKLKVANITLNSVEAVLTMPQTTTGLQQGLDPAWGGVTAQTPDQIAIANEGERTDPSNHDWQVRELDALLDKLSEQDRLIVCMHDGLREFDGNPLSTRGIFEELGRRGHFVQYFKLPALYDAARRKMIELAGHAIISKREGKAVEEVADSSKDTSVAAPPLGTLLQRLKPIERDVLEGSKQGRGYSEELAAELTNKYGREITPVNVRVMCMRARGKITMWTEHPERYTDLDKKKKPLPTDTSFIEQALHSLSPGHAEVYCRHEGINGYDKQLPKEIAVSMGMDAKKANNMWFAAKRKVLRFQKKISAEERRGEKAG